MRERPILFRNSWLVRFSPGFERAPGVGFNFQIFTLTNTNETPEIGCKLDGGNGHFCDLLHEGKEVALITVVLESSTPMTGRRKSHSASCLNPARDRIKRLAVSEHGRQVSAKDIREVVDPLLRGKRRRHQRNLGLAQRCLEFRVVPYSKFTDWIKRSRQQAQDHVQAPRKGANLAQQQPPQNARGLFTVGDCFLVLLLSDELRLFSNLRCSLRRLMGQYRDKGRRDCGAQANDDRSPISPASPRRRQRTDLHCRYPFLLEPILP